MELQKKNQAEKFLLNYKLVLIVYFCVTIFGVWGRFAKKIHEDGYTDYNNYVLFRESFNHLEKGKDLYINHPSEHFDLYKYSPGFAVLMAPFTKLPDMTGLLLWDLINMLVLFFGIRYLPGLKEKQKIFMLWFVLIELLTNIQNCQSNGLIAGLLVYALVFFEKKNVALASLCIIFSAYIKIFGIAAVVLALLYPDKIKFALYSFLWMAILTLLPLLITTPELLVMQYKSWYHLIANDHSISYGISLFGILHSWFSIEPAKNLIVLFSLPILLSPLLIVRHYKELSFRLLFFSSLLIWMVIFNHRGESPTYIIAITGIAIWFFSGKRNLVDSILVIGALLLTQLSPTDLFPRSFRNGFIIFYSLKALPCVLIWLKINYDLLIKKQPLELVN